MKKTVSELIYGQVIFVNQMYNVLLRDDFDLIRIAASHRALLKMGVKISEKRKKAFIELVKNHQQKDGGFTALRETLMIMEILYEYGEDIEEILRWVFSLVDENGGIHPHPRDRARMPDTALTYALLARLNIDNKYEQKMIDYITATWSKELYIQGGLTYKAGRYLSAYSRFPEEERNRQKQLYQDTISFVKENQREDGGFSPNKRDGLRSMPFYSSVVYKGLKDSMAVEGQSGSMGILDRLSDYMCDSSQDGMGWPEHERDYMTARIIYNMIEGGNIHGERGI